MLNGATPPIGTEIAAMEGGANLGSAMTTAGGKFSLQVQRPTGNTVTFTIAGVNASESLTTWQMGMIQSGFNLSATASGTVGRVGPPGPAGPAGPPVTPAPPGLPGLPAPAAPPVPTAPTAATAIPAPPAPRVPPALKAPAAP